MARESQSNVGGVLVRREILWIAYRRVKPVGIANMNAVTSRFGPCPKAFIVVPLVGAFLLDIINAFVIQTYIQIIG